MPTKKQLEARISMLNDALETALAVSPETDNTFFPGGLSGLYAVNRTNWDRKQIFAESLRAWRVNPIARRIVRLMTSFVVGKKLAVKAKDQTLQAWLDEWAKKNQLKKNLKRWKDEDTRTGNLFFLFNVLDNGMSILRAVPAERVDEIETDENDVEKELRYKYQVDGQDKYWEAPSPDLDTKLFMKHYASNQPVGSPWGEADLSPLLVWIGRYSTWLEDRVRLNHFRSVFMYVISGQYDNEADRAARQREVNATPPKPGSVLVVNRNNGEDWGILAQQLDSFDASVDGTAIKKMILDGAGHPMHWHAEPEGATQTTADAAGTPTFRTLEETQSDFFEMLVDLATTAATIAGFTIEPGDIRIEGSDITERDNATLALALGRSFPHLAELFDREGIDAKEFMRLVYKMFAEVWEGEAPPLKRKPLIEPRQQEPANEDEKTDSTDPTEEAE